MGHGYWASLSWLDSRQESELNKQVTSACGAGPKSPDNWALPLAIKPKGIFVKGTRSGSVC